MSSNKNYKIIGCLELYKVHLLSHTIYVVIILGRILIVVSS